MERPTVIISCNFADAGRRAVEQRVAEECVRRGLDVVMVPDVYHLAEDSPAWGRLSKCGEMLVLGWLHPRPLEWLVRRKLPGAKVEARDLGQLEADPGEWLGLTRENARATGSMLRIDAETSTRWYPIMDRLRCVSCEHCLQFCLFGVYERDAEGTVFVARPDNCKAGCPACSRVCPQSAIMFALYEKDGAIAGAPGEFVKLDPPARRMFYTRTGKVCPVCGQQGKDGARVPPEAELCMECGRARVEVRGKGGVADELDGLIGDLEKMMKRRA